MAFPQRNYINALAVFLLVLSCSFFLLHSDEPLVYDKVAKVPYRSSKPTLRDTITTLFEAVKHDPADPGYIDPTGQYYKGGVDKAWTRPLGKRVLIVDIDTRVPSGENQILNPGTLDWDALQMLGDGPVSNAIFNHYLYALIHGYDYKYYQAHHIPDHHDTWVRPHALHQLLPDYQFVVTMDADVTIPHLEVPLEWMFNRWGITNQTSMALPWDAEEFNGTQSISRDSNGMLVLNTGFIVAQNSPKTLEMLEAWRDCTSAIRYTGCGFWKQTSPYEQRAFSEYIRYDFNKTPEAIVSIPCDDAVASPGLKNTKADKVDIKDDEELTEDEDLKEDIKSRAPGPGCNGNFIRYHKQGRGQVKAGGASSVMQVMTQILQKNLLRQQESLWYKEPAEKVVIDDGALPPSPEIVTGDDGATEGFELSTDTKDLFTDLPE